MESGDIDCEKFELLLSEALERAHLPAVATAHLEGCAECAAMVSDFEAIGERTRQLSASDPVPDLWPEIRQQLFAEGIIHGDETCPAAPVGAPKLVHSAPSARRG